MKAYIIATLVLMTGMSYAAEKTTPPKVDKAAKVETVKKDGFLSGLYIAPVGIAKYVDLTDKPLFGVGLAAGFNLNKHVALDFVNIAFDKPDHYGGSAIDETDVMARFNLFSAAKNKLTLYGTAGGSRDWQADDWGLGVGAGLDYVIYGPIDAFGQYVYQVWDKQKRSGQVQIGIGYNF